MKLFHDPQEVIEVEDYYRTDSDKEKVATVEKLGSPASKEDL